MDKLIVNVDGNVSLACPNPSAILHIQSEMFRIFPEYQVQDTDTKRNVLSELKKWIKSEEAQLDNIVENSNSADGQAEKVNLPSTGMQQLKAEIADIVITLSRHKYSEFTKKTYNVLLTRMRQLSAV